MQRGQRASRSQRERGFSRATVFGGHLATSQALRGHAEIPAPPLSHDSSRAWGGVSPTRGDSWLGPRGATLHGPCSPARRAGSSIGGWVGGLGGERQLLRGRPSHPLGQRMHCQRVASDCQARRADGGADLQASALCWRSRICSSSASLATSPLESPPCSGQQRGGAPQLHAPAKNMASPEQQNAAEAAHRVLDKGLALLQEQCGNQCAGAT